MFQELIYLYLKLLSSFFNFSTLSFVDFFDPSTLIAVIDPLFFRSFNLKVFFNIHFTIIALLGFFGKKDAPEISFDELIAFSKIFR